MDEGKDWKTGIAEMSSQPSSVLNWASPAKVFNGGRMVRSAILPHFAQQKEIDVRQTMGKAMEKLVRRASQSMEELSESLKEFETIEAPYMNTRLRPRSNE